MKVDVAQRRKIEHPLRNDPAVTDHDDGSGLEGRELSAESVVVLDAFRLGDRQPQMQSTQLDRGRNTFESSPLGTIRLRDHEADAKSSADQPVEGRNGKTWRAAKHEIER